MANTIQTRVVTSGFGRSFPWKAVILGGIGAAVVIVGLANVNQVEQPTVNASSLTADSYRQYSEAMAAVPAASAGAITADSYHQFAEAMELVSAASAGAITADSYHQFAEAMRAVPSS